MLLRLCRWVIPPGLALVGLLLAASLALATHTATVSNIPGTASPNTSTSFTMTVTNNAGSANKIAKVELTVDADWTVPGSQPSPPQNWSVSVAGQVITWTANNAGARIAANKSKDFAWTATTGPAETSTHNWVTTDDAATPGTASGSFNTTVQSSPEFLWGAIPLGGGALLYWLLRRRRAVPETA